MSDYNPRPPGHGKKWFIPMTEWEFRVHFRNGYHHTVTVNAPFFIFAYGTCIKDANALYPEGKGVRRMKLISHRRLLNI